MRIDNWSSRFLTLLLISGSFAPAQLKSGLEESDPPSTHNMLVVGGKTVFLSHLPMFDDLSEDKSDYTSMHRYQVILEARFIRNRKDVTNIYTKDREANAGIKMYTLQPARFVLARLFTQNTGAPALRSFPCHHLSRSSRAKWRDDPRARGCGCECQQSRPCAQVRSIPGKAASA